MRTHRSLRSQRHDVRIVRRTTRVSGAIIADQQELRYAVRAKHRVWTPGAANETYGIVRAGWTWPWRPHGNYGHGGKGNE